MFIKPKPEHNPEAHFGQIIDVVIVRGEFKTYIRINLKSLDNGILTNLMIPVPELFEQNIRLGSKFDAAEVLSAWDYENYRRYFANRRMEAWLQRLVFNVPSIARNAGRDPQKLDIIPYPINLEQWVKNLHTMLQGVKVIFRMKNGELWDITDKDDFNPVMLEGYRLMWAEKPKPEATPGGKDAINV